jgi:hypothetical protein
LLNIPEIDLPVELDKIRKKGWVQSHRASDTGIGKTVEDLLGIPENNLGEPDCTYQGVPYEVKSRRLKTKSMLTLFTLEAGTRHLDDVALIRKYGYRNGKNRPALKITLKPSTFTRQGLKLEVNDQSIAIADRTGYKPWIWTTSDIHLKLRNLCVIRAETRKMGQTESFLIHDAFLATNLDTKRFFELVDDGKVTIDLRMHLKPSGASRNRGTGFRTAYVEDLMRCYEKQRRIL